MKTESKMMINQEILEWPDDAINSAVNLVGDINNKNLKIIDIGAHKGETFLAFNKNLKNDFSYWGFEPNSETFRSLIGNVGEFIKKGSIEFFEMAVGPSDGKVFFNKTKASAVAGILAPVDGLTDRVPSGDHIIEDKVQVEMVALDSFFLGALGDQEIDILKIDSEGYDLDIMKGASELFKRGKIKVVISEVFFVPYRQGQGYFWDIAKFLENNGYHFMNLYDTRETSQGRLYTGNAVWVSPKVAKQKDFL